jgi:hypothetical protein
MHTVKIFQVFHKDFPFNSDCKWLNPIGVNGYESNGFLSDAKDENISNLNPYYCELTALYWVLKNTKSNYVGLCHYRRYFSFISLNNYMPVLDVVANIEDINSLTHGDQYDSLINLLDFTDVIVPTKQILLPSIKAHYLNYSESPPWYAFIDALKYLYPNIKDPHLFYEINTKSSLFNMFVMKRPILEKYCSDLFTVINLVFKKIGSPYDQYNNRYPGFLAERFLDFWLMANKIYSIERPVIYLK